MSDMDSICLQCGICCDGTLFSGVVLQPKDNAQKLKARGLPLRRLATGARFSQPCAALTGCRCEIYTDRPQHCRRFECVVLQEQLAGRLSTKSALTIIRRAKRLAGRAAKMLTLLGDTGDKISLRQRYTKAVVRLNRINPTQEEASRFYELSTTMHQLNLLLSERFYPPDERPR